MRIVLSAVALATSVVLGCAPAAPASPPAPAKPAEAKPAAAPSRVLKVANTVPEPDSISQALIYWGDQVTQMTGGRLGFQYFHGGSLLNNLTMTAGVRDGVADLGVVTTFGMSANVPDVAIFDVPYAIPLAPDAMARFYGEIQPILDQIYSQNVNQRIMYQQAVDPTPMLCRDKFLNNEAAWRGTLVRVAGRLTGEVTRAWGASPVQIDLSDLYSGLQRGTVDCAALVYGLSASFRLHEVGKYLTRVDFTIVSAPTAMNKDTFNSLSADDQKALFEAGKLAEKRSFELHAGDVPRVLDAFKQAGMQSCTPSDAELQRLYNATKPVIEQIRQAAGPLGKQLVSIVDNYAKDLKPGPVQGDTTRCPA